MQTNLICSSRSSFYQGSIHAGLPQGNEEMIHGLNTYVIGNRTNPKGIVVIYSDIFGLPLPNNRLIADAYAKSGEYLVYLPDFFKGDPVPLATADVLLPVDASKQSTLAKYGGMLAKVPSFMMWMTRHKEGPTNDTCMEFLRKLRRATPATQKIGMVGFCWGGKYAIRAGKKSNMIEVNGVKKPLVDCVVALHPSHLALPGDVDDLVVPVSYGFGVEDEGVKFETKAKIEEIHSKIQGLPEMEHKVYRPGRHGFAVRGNPEDPQERKCLEDSEKQVLNWLERWM
jgi:dienelactone hydrolase